MSPFSHFKLLPLALLIPLGALADTAFGPLPVSAVTPTLTVCSEIWANASGGLHTGSHWNSLADLSLDLDGSAFGGPSGGVFTIQLVWVENQNTETAFGDLTGAANPVSGIQGGEALRVFNLFYRQSWGSDRFAIKVGQIAIDDDFMGSDYAGLFAHSALGAMPSQVATTHAGEIGGGAAFPIYAVAAPGIHFSVQPQENVFIQLATYHGGPGPDERRNHGFDWDSGSGQGAVLFLEGAYTFSLRGLPSTLRAGGSVHTGKFDDLRALADEAEAPPVRGLHSFYLMQDLVLAARDADHPALAAFWRLGLSPQQDRSVVHFYGDTGFNWFGPLPARPDDTLGLALSYTEYGDAVRLLETDLAAAETAIELTYRAQLNDHLAVQAILQRHFNPLPADDGRRHTTTVFGCRAELSF